MKILKQIADDEMVAVFLRAEIFSPRFSQYILPLLNRFNTNQEILVNPDINDPQQNELRRKILGNYRGYQQYSFLFKDFPEDVVWYRILLGRDELNKIKYIHDKYWNKLSNKKRYAFHGAENIRNNKTFLNIPNDGYWEVSRNLEKGKKFDEVILVGKDQDDELVILEGHERMTGFLLKPELLPEKLEFIVGLSHGMELWAGYGPVTKPHKNSNESNQN